MPQENLVTNDNNPSSIGTQTEHSSSKNSLEQKIESLGKEIKSLRKQNQLNSGIIGLGVIGLVGYIIATNWSAIAPALVAAGTAIAAAAPVIGIAIGAIIGAAVLVGASYAIWKYRAQIKAGFEYATEKTAEGAKELYGKAKGAAVRAKDSVKSGASTAADRLGDSLKRAAHSGEYSIKSEFVQESLRQAGIKETVNKTIEIIEAGNSSVPSAIKSTLKSAIDSNIGKLDSADQKSSLKEKDNLEKQRKIVNRLETILTKSILDTKELELITKVFSRYHNEVKGVLDDYDQNPEKYPKPPTLSQKVSRSVSSSFSSLRGKSPNNLSRSSSEGSVITANDSSTPAALDPKDLATIAGRPGVARRNSTGNLNRVEIPKVPTRHNSLPDLSRIENMSEESSLGNDLIVKENLGSLRSEPLTRSSSFSSSAPDDVSAVSKNPTSDYGSGGRSPNSSGDSTPRRHSLSLDDLNKSRLKETGLLNQLAGRPPSTKVDVDADVQHQTVPKSVA